MKEDTRARGCSSRHESNPLATAALEARASRDSALHCRNRRKGRCLQCADKRAVRFQREAIQSAGSSLQPDNPCRAKQARTGWAVRGERPPV